MRATTSKSTNQRLREDVAELDKRLIESGPEKPDISPLNLSAAQPEPDLRYQKIDSLRLSNKFKEDTLKSQLSDIKMLLKSVEMKKMQAIQENGLLRNPKSDQVETLKQEIQSLQEEYHISSTSNYKKKKLRDSTNQAKQIAYLETMGPLETQLHNLNEEERTTHEQMIKVNEEIRKTDNLINMSKEELISRVTQRAETIAQREETEEALESLKLQYVEVMGTNLEDLESWEGLSGIAREKEYYEDKVKELDNKSMTNASDIKKLKDEMGIKRMELYEILGVNNALEIESIEISIDEQCQDLDINGLGEIIMDINSSNNFEIDESIIKLQLSEIENKERNLKEEWTLHKQLLEEKVKLYKLTKSSLLKSAENELFVAFRKYRNRFAAISQWKFDVEQSINRRIQSTQINTNDRDILDEFKYQELSRVYDSSVKKSIENQLIIYTQKLSIRDKEILKDTHKIMDTKSALSQLGKELQLKMNLKLQIEYERTIAETEIAKLLKQENIILPKVDDHELDDEYLIREHAFYLLKIISHWEKCSNNHNQHIELVLKPDLKANSELLMKLNKESKLLSLKLIEIKNEQKNVKVLVENLIEKQKRCMYASLEDMKNPFVAPEVKLDGLNELIEQKTKELEEALVSLNKLEAELSAKISLIEQEENTYRAQHSTIENAIVKVFQERILIEEFENQFLSGDTERTARSPIIRSKSSERIRKLPRRLSQELYLPLNKDQDYYPHDLKDTFDADNLGEIPFEVAEKILGKQTQLMTERAAGSSIKKKKYYRFNLEDTTISEKHFFERITPLLEGAEFYKKFSQTNSLKSQTFDALDTVKHPPESCGYGVRYFRLHKTLVKINVRQPLKPGFESMIQIDQIIAPIIPQSTKSILKVQKKLETESSSSRPELEVVDRSRNL